MRARPNALLLMAVALALIAVSSGGARAQRYYSHGANQHIYVGRPIAPPHRGVWHRGRHWGDPGIVVMVPPRAIIDDGPYYPPPPHRSRARPAASGAPPANEHRYLPDEVVVEFSRSVSTAAIATLQRRFRLTPLESHRFALTGTTLVRWHIPDRRSVAAVVRALERERIVAAAQPDYLFSLQGDDTKPASAETLDQYAVTKLHLPQAHRLAKGKAVRVAVIDSAIDTANPELAGSIVGRFDALPTPVKPNAHGTAIAGLIAAHGRLMGAAPDAKILAICAFSPEQNGAQGTTFNILKGLDWAAAHDAQVINMSFAGPHDPALQRGLAAAHAKGIVLVAAAGNAGPSSPPLFPAAEPEVIAVTATTARDTLLPEANRGRQIDLAAPGAAVLVATPGGGYDVSSGTSYSAAEVSGIAALMLEREPAANPDRVRRLLLATAKDLGPKGRDSLFGAGLANAYGALVAEKPPLAEAAPVERASTGR